MSSETQHDTASGALVALSKFEARRLTQRITDALAIAWDLVAEAYARWVWEALGYPSWDAYCRAEFPTTRLRLPAEERQEVVGSLREAGMSTRAIASATGVHHSTVATDSRGVGNPTPVPTAGPITGLDGKQYPTRPAAPATPDGLDDEPIEAEIVDEIPEPRGRPATSSARSAPAATGRPRRALTEQAKDAGWELRKAIERVQRLTTDDRYPRHADQMATLLRGHLSYATDLGARLLEQMSDRIPEGDPTP